MVKPKIIDLSKVQTKEVDIEKLNNMKMKIVTPTGEVLLKFKMLTHR